MIKINLLGTTPKVCFRCSKKKLSRDFYFHPGTADGLLGKCIDCTRGDSLLRGIVKRESIRAYNRKRCREPSYRAQSVRWQQAYRMNSPEKLVAHNAVSNALRSGRIIRTACIECGSTDRVQGHHEDYLKPLEVEWLCFRCHRTGRHGNVVE